MLLKRIKNMGTNRGKGSNTVCHQALTTATKVRISPFVLAMM